MREIKFRAWDIGGGRMEYKLSPINLEEMFLCHTVDLAQAAKEHGHVLMQFTGLKDKNGREIYEGDIVKFKDGVGEVFWSGDGCWEHTFIEGFEQVGKRRFMFSRPPKRFWLSKEGVEVIGNIHENPELLKGERWRGIIRPALKDMGNGPTYSD